MLMRLLFAALLLSPAVATFAAVPPMQQEASSSVQAPAYPIRGMTMAQVRALFGVPERSLPPDPATAQGPLKPPIVRWIYPRFTVYFERGLVIHSVLTHPRRTPSAASPAGG